MDDLFAIADDDVEVVERHVRQRSPTPTTIPSPQAQEVSATRQARYLGDDETLDDTASYDAAAAARRRRDTEGENEFSLGLDEEVVIKKKRIIARLDDERLLEKHHGIPKLIKMSLERPLHKTLKGKGHTLQDMGRVLERYQFWCHEMYPKAKFRDALAMIRKAGSSKRMKMERRRFIDDLLPKPVDEDEDAEEYDDSVFGLTNKGPAARNEEQDASQALFFDDEDEDAEMALYADAPTKPITAAREDDHPQDGPPPYFDEEDDMDALEAMYS
ncbi:replication fork protection component Swi3-domain-containing protein [Protomyces lactucae-debilis]|uniref:Chromosome segregation in meiosis protein n=1 Tax=Protomyces lactucae-debilis TaxID=2754530 RepID=A0A1Y2F8R2_PROLT|nr:replication fork protection component Swi3-domain-containing protein [Protomyces lactucae-debilis]ORY79844.1 replication fork protection component Swi3-domain-containing protein [Protomyces lactucae-debilis]